MDVGILRMNILVSDNASYLNQKNHTLYEHTCLLISIFWLDMLKFLPSHLMVKKDNASGRKDLVGKR